MSWIIRAMPKLDLFEPLNIPPAPRMGDRVRLTERGLDKWGNQSEGTDGDVVSESHEGGFMHGSDVWWDVEWDCGSSNSYQKEDLEVLPK